MPALAVYPDAREALYELVSGEQFAGRTVTAYFQLQLDYVTVAQAGAAVLLYTTGGTEGHIDRVDMATIEVYAPGTKAVEIAEAIRAAIVDRPHDLDVGYIDDITCTVTPHDVPYQSEAVNLARAVYAITTRPH